jgi:phosphoribosyl-dephospho-CoA transferase
MSTALPSPLVHDLVLLNSYEVDAAHAAEAGWIKSTLRECPWVVVRRTLAPDGKISIGIRGEERQQRAGGFARYEQIEKLLSPRHLRSDHIAGNRRALPAMQSLVFLETVLSSFPLDWGPGGSVGYELASERPVVHAKSDLDLVIRAPKRLNRKFAEELWVILLSSPGKIDCRIETPACGFSLDEYIRSEAASLLVRTPAGPVLANDPWQLPSSGGER